MNGIVYQRVQVHGEHSHIRRMNENHKTIILEQLDCRVGATRCYVAGAVAAGLVVVFGGEEGADVDL